MSYLDVPPWCIPAFIHKGIHIHNPFPCVVVRFGCTLQHACWMMFWAFLGQTVAQSLQMHADGVLLAWKQWNGFPAQTSRTHRGHTLAVPIVKGTIRDKCFWVWQLRSIATWLPASHGFVAQTILFKLNHAGSSVPADCHVNNYLQNATKYYQMYDNVTCDNVISCLALSPSPCRGIQCKSAPPGDAVPPGRCWTGSSVSVLHALVSSELPQGSHGINRQESSGHPQRQQSGDHSDPALSTSEALHNTTPCAHTLVPSCA